MKIHESLHDVLHKPIEPDRGVARWALAFVGGKDTQPHSEPKSCFNCPFLYLNQNRCQIHGPDIVIKRIGDKYTPVCTYQKGGTPRKITDSEVVYNADVLGANAAESTGLEWAKSPTGTNCGGYKQGAPCEHFYVTDGKGIDGVCGLMKKIDRDVDWDDCCDGHEGEHISWQEAQRILKEKQ